MSARGGPAERVIAVDGPAGSGKSTAAKGIADRLGWDYLESGALYRAVGLGVLEGGGDPDDAGEGVRVARGLRFECRRTPEGWRNLLNGRDVTLALREERVSDAASRVSSIPAVREALLAFQRGYGKRGGAVLDGRDIGTVVFPDAPLKFFLDADIEIRIQRRFSELRERGVPFDPVRLGDDLRNRDRRDRERATAPLRPAKDAELIETTNMTIDRVLDIMLGKIREVFGEVIEVR